jgi:hypothetical protein
MKRRPRRRLPEELDDNSAAVFARAYGLDRVVIIWENDDSATRGAVTYGRLGEGGNWLSLLVERFGVRAVFDAMEEK